jgi:2-alkenal reductase
VTNNHVVAGAESIQVSFSDDTVITATLVARDPFADLAVIKVLSLPSGVQPLPLGRSADLGVGQIVVALGNPFGLPGSMTTSIISGLGRALPAGETAFRSFGPSLSHTRSMLRPSMDVYEQTLSRFRWRASRERAEGGDCGAHSKSP